MKKIAFLSIFSLVLCSASVQAQIYKWVDADGNVHFSDTPTDSDAGEQISIEHTNVMEGGQDLAKSASKYQERRQDQLEENKKLAAERAANYVDPCKAGLAEYRKFTEVFRAKNGVPYTVYRTNPDGSYMSQQDHNKMVEAMRVKLVNQGCM